MEVKRWGFHQKRLKQISTWCCGIENRQCRLLLLYKFLVNGNAYTIRAYYNCWHRTIIYIFHILIFVFQKHAMINIYMLFSGTEFNIIWLTFWAHYIRASGYVCKPNILRAQKCATIHTNIISSIFHLSSNLPCMMVIMMLMHSTILLIPVLFLGMTITHKSNST